jgi:hypothetical protein
MGAGMINMKKSKLLAVVALAAVSVLGCSSELTESAAPVELLVTHIQRLSVLDVEPGNEATCNAEIGTITMQVRPRNPNASGSQSAVRITRYQVSYRRTDGGTVVPVSFVRAIDTLIAVGGSAGSDFSLFQLGAFSQAPFAALLPQNGGRDAETLRPVIGMEVGLDVFGETLGGDNVTDSTTIPLEFCYDCGGCR